MADKSKVDARSALQTLKEAHLQQAKEIERDLEELDRLAEKYGLEVVGADKAEAKPPKKSSAKPRPNGAGPVSATIRTVAQDHLRRTGVRAMSSAIAKVLAAKGINVTAKRVASYMTRSDLFDNKPDFGGYGLAEWGGARTAPSAKEK